MKVWWMCSETFAGLRREVQIALNHGFWYVLFSARTHTPSFVHIHRPPVAVDDAVNATRRYIICLAKCAGPMKMATINVVNFVVFITSHNKIQRGRLKKGESSVVWSGIARWSPVEIVTGWWLPRTVKELDSIW